MICKRLDVKLYELSFVFCKIYTKGMLCGEIMVMILRPTRFRLIWCPTYTISSALTVVGTPESSLVSHWVAHSSSKLWVGCSFADVVYLIDCCAE
jgi:hypothetical protein